MTIIKILSRYFKFALGNDAKIIFGFVLVLSLTACSTAITVAPTKTRNSPEVIVVTSTAISTEVSPTRTLSPSPTSTYAITTIGKDEKKEVCIKVHSLSIRSGPGPTFNKVGYLLKDDCAQVLGRNKDNNWVKTNKGWIYSYFILSIEEVNKLAIVDDSSNVKTQEVLLAELASNLQADSKSETNQGNTSNSDLSFEEFERQLKESCKQYFSPNPEDYHRYSRQEDYSDKPDYYEWGYKDYFPPECKGFEWEDFYDLEDIFPSDTDNSNNEINIINWGNAINYVGSHKTVCGPVVRGNYAHDTSGQPTFLDLGNRYPNINRVTIVIWGRNRNSWSYSPEAIYLNETICVSGEIYIHDGIPNIEVSKPLQINEQ